VTTDKAGDVRAAVAERLKIAREHSGLSQGQVARLLGLHRPTVSEIEAGRRRVSAHEVKAFADLYHVTAAWLLGEHPESMDPTDARIQLAARELKKLKREDLDRVLTLLAAVCRDAPDSG
jgi:transcriptional regulator with XRE-family HTH domain